MAKSKLFARGLAQMPEGRWFKHRAKKQIQVKRLGFVFGRQNKKIH